MAPAHPSQRSRQSADKPFRFRAYILPTSTSDSPPKESVKARGKPQTACSSCRSRKLRCSGDRPQCTNCALCKTHCQYTAKPSSTPPGTSALNEPCSGMAEPLLAATQDLHRVSKDYQVGFLVPNNTAATLLPSADIVLNSYPAVPHLPLLQLPSNPGQMSSIATLRLPPQAFSPLTQGLGLRSAHLTTPAQIFVDRGIIGSQRLQVCFPCFANTEAQQLMSNARRATSTVATTFCALAMCALIEIINPWECSGWSKSASDEAKRLARAALEALKSSDTEPTEAWDDDSALTAAGLGFLALFTIIAHEEPESARTWLRLSAQVVFTLPSDSVIRQRLSRYLFFWDLNLRSSRRADGTRDQVVFDSAVGHELIGNVLATYRLKMASPPRRDSLQAQLLESIIDLCLELRFPKSNDPQISLTSLERWYAGLPSIFSVDYTREVWVQESDPERCENHGLAIAVRLLYYLLRLQFMPFLSAADQVAQLLVARAAVQQLFELCNFVAHKHKVSYWLPIMQAIVIVHGALANSFVGAQVRTDLARQLEAAIHLAVGTISPAVGSPELRYLPSMQAIWVCNKRRIQA